MTEQLDDLTCACCGGPTTVGQMKYTFMRGVGDKGAGKGGPIRRDFVFCSDRCVAGNIARVLAQAECSVCGKRVDRGPGDPGGGGRGSGRPSFYCTAKCRKAHESKLATAMNQLAKDSTPKRDADAIAEALSLALTLQRHWNGPDTPKLLDPPSSRARASLNRRIGRLAELQEQVAREVEQERAQQAAVEEQARRKALGIADAKADTDWRTALLDRLAASGLEPLRTGQ